MAKQLSREEAAEALFHELRGRILEMAMTGERRGALISLFMTSQSARLMARINEILDEFKPPPTPTEQAKADPVRPGAAPTQRK